MTLGFLRDDVLLSVGLFVITGTAAHFASRFITRKQPLEVQHFWHRTFRNLAMGLSLLGAAVIWKNELQSILVALGAAAAGLLVALRESWLSMLAFWIRVVKRHYTTGDYIEIDGIRGRVIDITWQHTILAETATGKDAMPFTGRQIQIPNNRMLLSPLFVENLTGAFTAYAFSLPLPPGAMPLKAQALLQAIAHRHCEAFRRDAESHLATFQQNQFIEAPSFEPRVIIRVSEGGKVSLYLRMVVPAKDKLRIEQEILRDFLYEADEDVWPRVMK